MPRRAQPYPVMQMTGGLDVSIDSIFLTDKSSPNLQNIRFRHGVVEKNMGWIVFGTEGAGGLPLSGAVMLIDTFPLYTGTIHYLMTTEKKTYRYVSATGLYSSLSASDWTGDQDNRFCSFPTLDSTGADTYLITNGKDPIKKWDGNTSHTLTDLLGWSTANIKASQIASFQSRLVAGFTTESGNVCPKRIRWSVAGDIEDISGAGSGFVELVETSDWIVRLVPMKGKLYVFKERSIWELLYVGGTEVFRPELILDGVGTYSPNAVVPLGEEVIFYGSDNVYLFDGIDLTPVGRQIYPLLYETDSRIVNGSLASRSAGVYIEELQQYALSLPGAESTIPDEIFTYDLNYESWSRRSKEATAFGYYTVPSGTIWSDGVGTWANQTGVWMDKALSAGAPTTLVGSASGYIYEDDQITTDTDYMCFDSKDFMFEHAERWTEFRIQAMGGAFVASVSIDGGLTWVRTRNYAAQDNWTDYSLPLNLTSQKVRLRIESEASSLKIKWIEPWYIPRARFQKLQTS